MINSNTGTHRDQLATVAEAIERYIKLDRAHYDTPRDLYHRVGETVDGLNAGRREILGMLRSERDTLGAAREAEAESAPLSPDEAA